MNTKQLRRIPNDGVVGGVAAGVADYLGIDKAIVRVIFIALFIFGKGFPMFLLYVILWVALPIAESASGYVAERTPFTGINSKNLDWLGYGLLAVGGIMLFDKLFYWIHFDRYIPAVLFIGAGLFFIFRQNQKGNDYSSTPYNSTYTEPVITKTETIADVVEDKPTVTKNDSNESNPETSNNL